MPKTVSREVVCMSSAIGRIFTTEAQVEDIGNESSDYPENAMSENNLKLRREVRTMISREVREKTGDEAMPPGCPFRSVLSDRKRQYRARSGSGCPGTLSSKGDNARKDRSKKSRHHP